MLALLLRVCRTKSKTKNLSYFSINRCSLAGSGCLQDTFFAMHLEEVAK